MGSFNEVCALSNHNIGYGDPVRLLFLTKNPYVVADQREDHRGCYHYDHWFVRTPPIKGTYDDYGRATFKEGPITELIEKFFDKDVVERPFGFNQYHTADVTKGKGIHHYLLNAWQGRLLVKDEYRKNQFPPPDNWPTWEKIHAMFKKARMPIQMESKDESGKAGYNAQEIAPGIICVDYNSYDDNTKRLEKAARVLAPHYDTRLVSWVEDRPEYEIVLMVVPKGAFNDPTLLQNKAEAIDLMTTHPKLRRDVRQLPVLAVMVREDVWQTYATLDMVDSRPWCNHPLTVEGIRTKLEKGVRRSRERPAPTIDDLDELAFRDMMCNIPFMTTASTHLAAVDKDFPEYEQLLQSCAELARIEYVMANIHQAWHPPVLGGQDGEWELRTRLWQALTDISHKEMMKEKAEYEGDNDLLDEDDCEEHTDE